MKNKEALRILRVRKDQMLNRDIYDPQWRIIDPVGKVLNPEEYPVSVSLKLKKSLSGVMIGIVDSKKNIPTWAMVNVHYDGNRAIVSFTDVTKEYSLPFKQIADNAGDGVLITRADDFHKPGGLKLVYANDFMETISGYSKEELIGKSPKMLQGKDTDKSTCNRIRKSLEQKKPVREVILNYSKKGKPYWVEISIFPLYLNRDGEVTHFAAIERDVTESHNAQTELLDESRRDPLTKLLNRRGFDILSQEFMAFVSSKNMVFSLILIDIDHFKKVNDDFSHHHGDQVLIQLSRIIASHLRVDDIAARFGGEEFLIMLPLLTKKKALKIAERIRKEVEESIIEVDGSKIDYTISCGVASSNDSMYVENAIKLVDKALYAAKRKGRNRSVEFL